MPDGKPDLSGLWQPENTPFRFDVIQDTADPSRFEFIEVYRDASGHAAHRESPHYKSWAARVEDMMAEPRSRSVCRNIHPPDDAF